MLTLRRNVSGKVEAAPLADASLYACSCACMPGQHCCGHWQGIEARCGVQAAAARASTGTCNACARQRACMRRPSSLPPTSLQGLVVRAGCPGFCSHSSLRLHPLWCGGCCRCRRRSALACQTAPPARLPPTRHLAADPGPLALSTARPCSESPQWRRGPPHKAILCNACGTRYR